MMWWCVTKRDVTASVDVFDVKQMTSSSAADIEMSEKTSLHAVEDAETNSGHEEQS